MNLIKQAIYSYWIYLSTFLILDLLRFNLSYTNFMIIFILIAATYLGGYFGGRSN